MSNEQHAPNTSGLLDPSFGDAGKVIVQIPDSTGTVTRIHGLAIDADEGVLLSSTSKNHFVLGRLFEDGSLDKQFGNGGWVRDVFASAGNSTGISVSILNKNGSILLSGVHNTTGSYAEPALALFTAAGHYDTDFGQHGKIVIPLPNDPERSAGLAEYEPTATSGSSRHPVILGDGKLLLVHQGWLIRLLKNGQPDSSFHNGKHYRSALHPIYPSNISRIVQVSADTVVLGGNANVNGEIAGMLTRYFTNGELDPSFGQDGFVLLSNLGFDTNIVEILLKDNNQRKVVAVGQKISSPLQGYMVCIDETGNLDAGFNDGRPVLTPTDPNRQFVWHAAAIDTHDRIIATGGSFEGNGGLVYLPTGRFLADGTPDFSFSANGGWVATKDQLGEAITIDHKGRIVIGGFNQPSGEMSAILLRYLA